MICKCNRQPGTIATHTRTHIRMFGLRRCACIRHNAHAPMPAHKPLQPCAPPAHVRVYGQTTYVRLRTSVDTHNTRVHVHPYSWTCTPAHEIHTPAHAHTTDTHTVAAKKKLLFRFCSTIVVRWIVFEKTNHRQLRDDRVRACAIVYWVVPIITCVFRRGVKLICCVLDVALRVC